MFEKLKSLLQKKPLSNFGKNHPEFYHKGKEAVAYLLKVKKGQVAGAFYRDDIGDIDLVWGNDNFGLKHILKRRQEDYFNDIIKDIKTKISPDDFKQNKIQIIKNTKTLAKSKALDFVKNDLDEIIKRGNIFIDEMENRAFLETNDKKVVVSLDYNEQDRKWILTAYNKYKTSPRQADLHKDEAHGTSFSSSHSAEVKNNSTTNSFKNQANLKEKFENLGKIVNKNKIKRNSKNIKKADEIQPKKENLNKNNLGGNKIKKPPRI